MGTSNFHSRQVSQIFAVETSYFDEEIDDFVQDEWIWEDTRNNIIFDLDKIDKDKSITQTIDWQFVSNNDVKLEDELRSFPATSIGEMYTGVHYGGTDWTITLVPKTVSGYYSGFCLDFEICVSNDQGYGEIWNDGVEQGVSEDDMQYMFEEYEYQEPHMKGMLVIHGSGIIKAINIAILQGVNLLEDIFAGHSN